MCLKTSYKKIAGLVAGKYSTEKLITRSVLSPGLLNQMDSKFNQSFLVRNSAGY